MTKTQASREHRRWYQDKATGLPTIRRHPDAPTETSKMTPDQVKNLLQEIAEWKSE